ncbi:hypothetical protein PR048_003167 [Dryococelus australis]|uniref:Uncharacterized protein n=1 Tax=Dryococelus australis TaxID=614101 RepID=A0ABQ9IMD1_9NEOP|nr:hypothetical protein PR048_003167 [Dryococelus australis]
MRVKRSTCDFFWEGVWSNGVAVTQREERLPLTKAYRIRFPAGSLSEFSLVRESCWKTPLVSGFSRDLPFPPPFHSGAAPYSPQSPASALKTSLLKAAQIFSLTLSPTPPLHTDLIGTENIQSRASGAVGASEAGGASGAGGASEASGTGRESVAGGASGLGRASGAGGAHHFGVI